MVDNRMPNVNFKGFMADNAQAHWNMVMKIYGEGDTNVPVGCEHSCDFHWSTSLDEVT